MLNQMDWWMKVWVWVCYRHLQTCSSGIQLETGEVDGQLQRKLAGYHFREKLVSIFILYNIEKMMKYTVVCTKNFVSQNIGFGTQKL